MEGFSSCQVVNGTWGEMWYDGEYLAEVLSCKGEVTAKYEAISSCQKLVDGQKLVGLEGKGEFKLHKVSSTIMKKVSESFKNGKVPLVTIISAVNDPDAIGGERIAYYNCAIDKVTLSDWEAGKNGEESYSFTFEDWEILDSMN